MHIAFQQLPSIVALNTFILQLPSYFKSSKMLFQVKLRIKTILYIENRDVMES
jgi:hypothetical protein